MTNWMLQAACRGTDPELFTPAGWDGPALVQIAEAKTVCRGCPVAVECLAEAFAAGDVDTIRGGTTPAERRKARQRAEHHARPAQADHELAA